MSKYSWFDFLSIPKSLVSILFLISSGTKVAVANTRNHAKKNLYTERGRTCDIFVTPISLLWKLPNSQTDGYDCWRIQPEHPGEPLKVVVSAPAADAACPSLKHPMQVGRNLQKTNLFQSIYEGMLYLKDKNPSCARTLLQCPVWVNFSYQEAEHHHREKQFSVLVKSGLRPFGHIKDFFKQNALDIETHLLSQLERLSVFFWMLLPFVDRLKT